MAPSSVTNAFCLITTFLYHTMPRKSKRFKNSNVSIKLNDELSLSNHQFLMEDKDHLQDEMGIDCFLLLEECKSGCYLFHLSKYRKYPSPWQKYFDYQLFNDDDFREHFCLSQHSFY
jgi:hypothetical protein